VTLIHGQLPASLPLAEGPSAPDDIQYMPPGRHRIRASRAGRPATLDVVVTAETAATLQRFLAEQLGSVAAGREDRPFFDFNHEDREASAWPTEFYWAGDDPASGGVRARLEWSESGRRAVEGRAFRRFSPTFYLDAAGRVTGSSTNMGGLVNRAAFKRIAPLIASAAPSPSMQNLIAALATLGLVEANASEEADLVAQVTASAGSLRSEIAALKTSLETQAHQRADASVEAAIKAGRLPAKDADARAFWVEALLRDEPRAIKALEALPAPAVLGRVLPQAGEHPSGPASALSRQEQKIAAIRAAYPSADFATIYAKAKAEDPDLFR
jgi:phage I-like protein